MSGSKVMVKKELNCISVKFIAKVSKSTNAIVDIFGINKKTTKIDNYSNHTSLVISN